MARIRTIKPEFGQHDRLSALPAETHLIAALLLPYSDDYGYFNANPKLIQAAICPLRELSREIPEHLRSLQEIGYIEVIVGSDGRQYGRITNFNEHQRVSHPTPSKISPLWSLPETFVKPPETFRPEVEQGTGNREVEQGMDLDAQVHEIAGFHPKVHDRFNLSRVVAEAIARAIARDGWELVWAGTKCMAEAVGKWPVNERRFLSAPENFFNKSEYRADPAEWERSNGTNGNGKPVAKADLVQQQIIDARNEARRAVGLDH